MSKFKVGQRVFLATPDTEQFDLIHPVGSVGVVTRTYDEDEVLVVMEGTDQEFVYLDEELEAVDE